MINRLSKSKSDKSSPKAVASVTTTTPTTPVAVAAAATLTSHREPLRTAEVAARPATVRELGTVSDRPSTSALVAALRDPSAEVAIRAAGALGAMRDAAAVESLIAVVVNADGYHHNNVRIAAVEALAKIQDRRAVDVLIKTTGDAVAEVSQAAVRSLGLLGDERAINALVKIVRNENNYYLAFVRQSAVEALSRLAAPTARESLRQIAADGHLDLFIRQAARAVINSPN